MRFIKRFPHQGSSANNRLCYIFSASLNKTEKIDFIQLKIDYNLFFETKF